MVQSIHADGRYFTNPASIDFSHRISSPFARKSLWIRLVRKVFTFSFEKPSWQYSSDCTALSLQWFICWFRNIAGFKKSSSQYSVSKHSFCTISNFEIKSFLPWAYCASWIFAPILVPERNSWLVRTDSLYFDLTITAKKYDLLGKVFWFTTQNAIRRYIITPTNYIIKLFTCKETVICLAALGVIFLPTQKWYCAVGTVILYSPFTLAKRISPDNAGYHCTAIPLAVRRI